MYKKGDIIYANDNYRTFIGNLKKFHKYKIDEVIIQKDGLKTYKISGDYFNGNVFYTDYFYKKNEIRKLKLNNLI